MDNSTSARDQQPIAHSSFNLLSSQNDKCDGQSPFAQCYCANRMKQMLAEYHQMISKTNSKNNHSADITVNGKYSSITLLNDLYHIKFEHGANDDTDQFDLFIAYSTDNYKENKSESDNNKRLSNNDNRNEAYALNVTCKIYTYVIRACDTVWLMTDEAEYIKKRINSFEADENVTATIVKVKTEKWKALPKTVLNITKVNSHDDNIDHMHMTALIKEITQFDNVPTETDDNIFVVPLQQEIIENENEYMKCKQTNKKNIDYEYDMCNLLATAEILKKHPKYKIMIEQNAKLLDNELIATIYYTDSNSCCHHWNNNIKWNRLYFHISNAVFKMFRVFHYENDQVLSKMLFHTTNTMSAHKLFSCTTQLSAASWNCTECILIIDAAGDKLYSGKLKGADVSWISKSNEIEWIILSETINNARQMSKELISNDLHNDLNNEYKDIKYWFDSEFELKKGDKINYFNLFIENGYDTFEVIKEIESSYDLNDIGIHEKGHIKNILKNIKLLPEYFNNKQKQIIGNIDEYKIEQNINTEICECKWMRYDTIPANQFVFINKKDKQHIAKFHPYLYHRLLDNEKEHKEKLGNQHEHE